MSSPSRTPHHEEDDRLTPISEESGRRTPRRTARTPTQQIENGTATPSHRGIPGRRTPGRRDVCNFSF